MNNTWTFFREIFEELIESDLVFNDFISKMIIKSIYSYVENELYDKTQTYETDDTSEVEICKKNIMKIKNLLEESDKSRDTFFKKFPKWRENREENVEKLNKIAETLHDEKKIINVVKSAASIVGVAGGAAILTSIFFPPAAVAILPSWLGGSALATLLPSVFAAAPAISAATWAGGAACATSGVTQIGTAVSEFILLKKKIEEAQSIVKKDIELTTELNGWFKHTKEFNETMEDLLNSSVWKIVFKDILVFLKEFNKLKRGFNCDKIKIISMLNNFLFKIRNNIAQHVVHFNRNYIFAITCLLLIIFLIGRDNRILLSCILATISINVCIRAGVSTSSGLAAVATKGSVAGWKSAPGVVIRNVSLGIFAGIGIALDTANLVLTGIDIAKGSVSGKGKEIEEVSNLLDEELEVLKFVHRELIFSTRNFTIDSDHVYHYAYNKGY